MDESSIKPYKPKKPTLSKPVIRSRELLSEKLSYILEYENLTNLQLANTLGYSKAGMISRWKKYNDLDNTIPLMAQESIEKHYKIPLKIWDKEFLFDKEKIHKKIIKYREELQKEKEEKIKNEKLRLTLQKENEKLKQKIDLIHHNPMESILADKKKEHILKILSGRWYAYVYAEELGQTKDDIWSVEIDIDKTGIVNYPNNNGKGFVNVRLRDSYIEKVTGLNNTTVLIRFSNDYISYKIFYVAINTIDMADGKPILNLAFFSRRKYTTKEAKNILSSREKSQLKLNLEFHAKIIKEHQY